MEDAFFKTADRSFGFRFHGNPLDRASEQREDAAFLAALRARSDARTLLIARDMPNPRQGRTARTDVPLETTAALGGARVEILLGLEPSGAPFLRAAPRRGGRATRGSQRRLSRQARVVVPGRDRLELIDLALDRRSGAGSSGDARHSRASQGDRALARAPWFLPELRRAEPVAAAGWRRECDVCKTQHFPRTDPVVIMLADRRRALPARASGPLSQEDVFRRSRVSWSPGNRSRRPCGAKFTRKPASHAGWSATSPRNPGRSQRRLMIGCLARAETRELRTSTGKRARRCALVRTGRSARNVRKNATPRACWPQSDGDRASHPAILVWTAAAPS